jgi:hypothetical protein
MHAHINEIPKRRLYLRQTASFEPSCMLCDAQFDRYAIAKKEYQRKRPQNRYISRMRDVSLSIRLQLSFAHLLRSPT